MGVLIHNPYENDVQVWQKGNLHAHTVNSDGEFEPQVLVDAYAAHGYDFLMISDHDFFTDPGSLDPQGMVLIPGNEISAGGPHILHVGADGGVAPNPDRQVVLDAIGAQGGFAIMCHPNWEEHFNHCPHEQLERWHGYAGIEIGNGVCFLAPGSGLATDRWDRLLGKGRRVWGYGNDDAHKAQHLGLVWNMVQCEQQDAGVLMDALCRGRFYVSTGVVIEHIEVHDNVVRLAAPMAQRIIAFGDFQRRLETVDGNAVAFPVSPDANFSYVRFECWGPGEQVAWTQPFFIERH